MTENIFEEQTFNEGFSMMVANEENKAIEKSILKLQENTSILRSEVDRDKNRTDAMSEHLKNVKNEIDYSHDVLKSRRQEIENEVNMGKINDMQLGRLQSESKAAIEVLEELHDRKNTHQNRIFLLGRKIDDVKSKINWDQSKLEIWLEESAKHDEDLALMKKYIKEDQSKLKELTLHINRLTEEKKEKVSELERVTTDKITAQYELEKLAEIYRSSKNERSKIISQWDDLIKQMNSRDKEIEKLALELGELKVEISNKEDELKNKLKFYENQTTNNVETEKKIFQAERASDSLRLDLQKISTARAEFKEELEVLKRTVNGCAQELEKKRLESHVAKNSIDVKKEKLDLILANNDELCRDVDSLEERFKSAEEYANEMERILNNEEMRCKELDKQLKMSRNKLFETNQEGENKKRDVNFLKTKIEGAVVTLRHLESRVTKYDAEILRQEELIYNQDYEIQHLNRRIDTMQGDRGDTEKDELEKQLLGMKETFEQRVEAHAILETQVKSIEDELRKAKKLNDSVVVEKENYRRKIGELNLHIENAQKELKGTIKRKENFLVESNVLKLDLDNFRTKLAENEENIVLSKERDLKLNKAITERQAEIKHHHELLMAQIKNAETDKSDLNLKYHSKMMEIDKLKRKHELLTVSMQPPEGEVVHSQAYFIIKAAQQKEELKLKGERLNSEILKAEEELHALENTVQLINDRNSVYKNGFCTPVTASQETELETAEKELQELRRTIRGKNKSVKAKTDELRDIIKEVDDYTDEFGRSKEELQATSKKLAKVKVDGANLGDKVKRAIKNNQRLEKDIVSAGSKAVEGLGDKKDVLLKDLKFLNETITRIFLEQSSNNDEIYSRIMAYFKDNDVPVEFEDSETTMSTQKSSSRLTSSKMSSASSP